MGTTSLTSYVDEAPTNSVDAVTEWWTQPIATYLPNNQRIVHGAISSTGEILACEKSLVKNSSNRVVVGSATIDDHNAPALWAEEGRRFIIGWSNHNTDAYIHFKCSNAGGDIRSFANAATYTFTSAGVSAYVQIIKISHLSSASEDVFYVFYRRSTIAWEVFPMYVAQASGIITFGTAIMVFRTPTNQSYISIADKYVASPGNQVIRVAQGYNPAETLHAINGFEIDVVTGAITNVADGTFTANLDGTNLPIEDTVPPIPFVAEPAAGNSRRLFYVRPGPDPFAVAYADWATATPDAAVYKTKEIPLVLNGEGLQKTSPTVDGYAQADYIAAMQTNTFEYTIFFTFTSAPVGSTTELGRRANSSADGAWWFRLLANRTVLYRLIHPAATTDFTGTVALPGAWTDRIGLRLVVNNASTPKVAIDYSIDGGSNWVSLEQQNPAALSNGFKVTSSPLVIPALPTINETDKIIVDYVSFKTGTGGTVIAEADFANDWLTGSTTYTDSASVAWSLVGAIAVDGLKVPFVTEYGVAGPRVGYTAEANYIGGMAFKNPSNGGTVYTAHSEGGFETLKVHMPTFSSSETVYSSATTIARLVRPYAPINSGPEDLIFTEMQIYSPTTYTDFLGTVKIV